MSFGARSSLRRRERRTNLTIATSGLNLISLAASMKQSSGILVSCQSKRTARRPVSVVVLFQPRFFPPTQTSPWTHRINQQHKLSHPDVSSTPRSHRCLLLDNHRLLPLPLLLLLLLGLPSLRQIPSRSSFGILLDVHHLGSIDESLSENFLVEGLFLIVGPEGGFGGGGRSTLVHHLFDPDGQFECEVEVGGL